MGTPSMTHNARHAHLRLVPPAALTRMIEDALAYQEARRARRRPFGGDAA